MESHIYIFPIYISLTRITISKLDQNSIYIQILYPHIIFIHIKVGKFIFNRKMFIKNQINRSLFEIHFYLFIAVQESTDLSLLIFYSLTFTDKMF